MCHNVFENDKYGIGITCVPFTYFRRVDFLFNSIQFYLYSAKTIQLSQGALQSPGLEPPLEEAQFA